MGKTPIPNIEKPSAQRERQRVKQLLKKLEKKRLRD